MDALTQELLPSAHNFKDRSVTDPSRSLLGQDGNKGFISERLQTAQEVIGNPVTVASASVCQSVACFCLSRQVFKASPAIHLNKSFEIKFLITNMHFSSYLSRSNMLKVCFCSLAAVSSIVGK